MKITAVRHGETIENREGIIQGQTYGTLTNLGKRQIEELAEKLKDKEFDIIYVSDLERCKLTATAVMQYHQETPFAYDVRLRERSLKPDEGRSFADLGWTHDEIHGLDVRTAEGETWNDVQRRVEDFIVHINAKPDQNILLVTHGGPIRILESILGNEPLEKTISHFHENCEILEWEV